MKFHELEYYKKIYDTMYVCGQDSMSFGDNLSTVKDDVTVMC